MTEPLVSVVMNCYNSDRYLREAIDSVFAQTRDDWEIVFFDNASTDRSAEIAKSYDSRLRYFRNPTTISLGAARNAALAKCRGKFIAFLDCDDLWDSTKLERQMPLFDDQEVGLVFANNFLLTTDGVRRENFRSSNDYSIGRCFGPLMRRYFLAIPAVVVRRASLDGLGEWFDPRFSVCEEVELFLRIAHDWKLAMCAESLATYRVHAASETWRKSEMFLAETLLILEKFRSLYPEFDERYANEAQSMLDRAYWSHAVFCWRDGKRASAYKAVWKMTSAGPKAYLFLLLVLLPYRWMRPILGKFGRVLPR